MIVTTTTAIDGQAVIEYAGVVTGEAVLGANVFRDLFVDLRAIVGGRSAGYKRSLRRRQRRLLRALLQRGPHHPGPRSHNHLLPHLPPPLRAVA
jgi:uncharacterized protein YbjQ (UPF0145 family)